LRSVIKSSLGKNLPSSKNGTIRKHDSTSVDGGERPGGSRS
jgi:hypothetical protein